MKVYDTEKIRNICFAGHSGAGKTTLVSALLYQTGKINRLLTPDEGNAPTDFDEDEKEKKISIQTATAFIEYDQHKINLIDTPGYGIFISETLSGIQAADAVFVVVNGQAGIEVQTDKAVKLAQKANLPIFFVITKIDKEHVQPDRLLEQLREKYGHVVIPLSYPLGTHTACQGVMGLITSQLYAQELTPQKLPEEAQELFHAHREKLVEKVAEGDETLMEKYFDQGDLEQDDLIQGLQKGILDRDIYPVFFINANPPIGIGSFLSTIIPLTPSPSHRRYVGKHPLTQEDLTFEAKGEMPFSAQVFKTFSDPYAGRISLMRVISGTMHADSTYYNPGREVQERVGSILTMIGKEGTSILEAHAGDIVSVTKLKETLTSHTLCEKNHPIIYPPIPFPEPAISFAIKPKSKGDEEKISSALHKIIEEDPVLQTGRDPQTKELLISGMGQLHVELVIARMKRKFGVDVALTPPKVPYRETITKKAETTYRHKKQTGGRGQFAECKIIMEPLPRGEGYKFVDKIFGGAISQNFRPAVDKGIQDAAAKGVLAGYPVVDFQVTLVDGKEHSVDSSEMAFKIAGSMAFKEAAQKAGLTLLEPIMRLEVYTPDEFTGDVMGDLNGRRGKVSGMDMEGDMRIIRAQVPLAEVLTYASELRSMTQGRASFHMEFSHYEEVPRQLQAKIIAESKAEE